ncbi:MAG: hypothetical protein RBU37_06620, partial [Myxococcota bacterium]|nr:hypothetical protein [Myxococcota bacterium]
MSFKQFSTLLVQDGVVPIHKVEEAFQRQILFGGRLGTNLLEIGALDEATLLRYLAKASEIPFAGRSLLLKREARARAALPADKVRLERALPIAFHNELLLLLVTDPLDAGKVQELEQAAGCRVEQRITNELRFDSLMHELYGDPLEKRTEQLLQRFPLSQAPDDERDEDDGWGELEKQALADWDISSPPAAAASTPEPIPPAAAIINPRRRSRAESGALSYDDFLKVLEGNASRDELYRAFCRFCLSLARRCAVFAVLDERVRCLVLEGPSGVDAKELVISVRAQSDLAEVCRGHSYYQGPSVDTELA